MTLHEKLAALRRERNISQEKLAEIIGVSRQSVAKWESGESLPEIDKLILLSNFFAASIDSLVKQQDGCASFTAAKSAVRDVDPLLLFLCKAKKHTYAGHGAETVSSRPASHDLEFAENGWFYYDTYLGGERFSGEEAVWKEGVPLWSMNYSGRVLCEGFSGDFLKEALATACPDYPWRGRPLHANGVNTYHCSVTGSFEWFSGNEEIFSLTTRVYECMFHGGVIK